MEVTKTLCQHFWSNFTKKILSPSLPFKEINKLISIWMSNIYQLLLRKSDVLKSSQFKKFISRSTFRELQPKQISLSFQTSCYNLKIRGLGPNLCEHFPVDTLHRFNVYKTSLRRRRRRIDVLQTLKRHLVSTGPLLF